MVNSRLIFVRTWNIPNKYGLTFELICMQRSAFNPKLM